MGTKEEELWPELFVGQRVRFEGVEYVIIERDPPEPTSGESVIGLKARRVSVEGNE